MALVDELLLAQLESFYLVGSVAQGDYQEGRSDVDFVAVLASPIELDALALAHTRLSGDFPEMTCDGIYLLPGELSWVPSGKGVAVREGAINPCSAEERTPVVWQVLVDDGIVL
jgi:hypothetical protein